MQAELDDVHRQLGTQLRINDELKHQQQHIPAAAPGPPVIIRNPSTPGRPVVDQNSYVAQLEERLRVQHRRANELEQECELLRQQVCCPIFSAVSPVSDYSCSDEWVH